MSNTLGKDGASGVTQYSECMPKFPVGRPSLRQSVKDVCLYRAEFSLMVCT